MSIAIRAYGMRFYINLRKKKMRRVNLSLPHSWRIIWKLNDSTIHHLIYRKHSKELLLYISSNISSFSSFFLVSASFHKDFQED